MKRVLGIVLCFFLMLSCVVPAMAANDVPEEVMEATKSVVRILSEYYNGAATGSGFVIKNEPGEVLIVTNNHVVEGNPTSISVWVAEDELVEAEIVFTTAKKDLCVLRLTDSVDMEPLTLSKEDARQGQAVYAVGYPGVGDVLSDSVAHTSEAATITDGIISAVRTYTIEEGADPTKLLQINAAINPGNSGGPLFNARGEVIGVNTYKVNKDSQGIFGAVDISELWTLLRRNGIEIPEKEAEPETEPEPAAVEKPFPVGAAVGAAGAVVFAAAVAILASRKKRPKRKNQKQKTERTVTLREYLQNYPQGLGICGAVSLLLPAGIALRNYHNDGKLHLEICPESILVGDHGATLKNPSGQEAGRFHSGFAAPEIYKGAGYGITSDIYSFGAVLYFAATGKVLANSLQQDALEKDLDALEDTAFAQVLRKSMAPNVQDRTQSMQELIYGIAVFDAPGAAPKAAAPVVEEVPASVTETPAVFPVAETVEEPPIAVKEVKPRKKARKLGKILLPIGAVVACAAIASAVLLWKPTAKPEEPPVAAAQETQAPTETTIPLSPEEAAYVEAEDLLAVGDRYGAATAFYAMGDYRDARERSFALWEEIAYRETISAGGEHTAGLKVDGTVVAVGLNGDGQCDVSGWQDCVAVGAGAQHTVGLKADGTVVAVGHNEDGQCDVSGWTDIVTISAGPWHTVGLKANGTVVAAGSNGGKCDVSDWQDCVAVSAGYWHTVGLKADGTVVAVGNNEYGQCDVSEWTDIVAISAGDFHTVGLKSDGTVVAVGSNDSGRCNVSDWTDIVAISAGDFHTVGLKADGTVVAVGSNLNGQRSVVGWQDCVAVSAGSWHTVGLKSDGTVVAVGCVSWDNYGQCKVSGWKDIKLPTQTLPPRNNHETKPEEENPSDQQAQYEKAEELLAAGETAQAAIAFGKLGDYRDARERSFALWEEIAYRETISAGGEHTAGLKVDGTVVAVGLNGDGQCDVSGWQDCVAISAGNGYTIGLKADGTVVAVGSNGFGQCDVSDWRDCVAVSAGWCHTVGLKADGTVMAVGDNREGQCDVSGWTDIVAVSVRDRHTIGLKADGTVVAVGSNLNGQCDVSGWRDCVAVSTERTHTVGLKADGTVVAVGDTGYGKCNVSGWQDCVAVDTGVHYTVGLKDDGMVVAVGSNEYGNCNVSGWQNCVAVSAGSWHTVGLKSDGTVVAVGWSEYGQCNVSGWTDIKLPK